MTRKPSYRKRAWNMKSQPCLPIQRWTIPRRTLERTTLLERKRQTPAHLDPRNRQGTWDLEESDIGEDETTAKLDLDLSSNPEQVLHKKGFRLLSSGAKGVSSPRLEALTALCHAVLTSNEFLYLH